MKLDPTVIRTMGGQDFRVLEAVEKGMQKHSLVPAPLISSLANLRHGGTPRIVSSLLRDKLLSHDKSCGYDGYRLTNAGYDILALHTLKTRKVIAAIGDRIGTGKESDVYLAVAPSGQQIVLKFHRLGRTSFRNVKQTRDYFVYQNNKKGGNNGQQSAAHSWLFLSRKSALKEFAFMKALYNVDYPTPEPLAHNRHVVAMSLVRGVPLYQVSSRNLSPEQASSIFHQASDLAVRLAKHGLVHCDLNEFNLLVDVSGIQQTALSQEHDPYVRHSGMSVAAESNPGMLSARGPWEPEYLQPPPADAEEGTVVEPPPKPAVLLDNGEPQPIVTLIDFPQMVSTQHPNASELYERDMACLYKFFSHKLQFRIPESEQSNLYLTWESLQDELNKQQKQQQLSKLEETSADPADDNGNESTTAKVNNEQVCLASKAQLRLDQELQASGYSEQDASRDMELYYYYNDGSRPSDREDGIVEEEGDDDEEDEDVDNDNDGKDGEKPQNDDDHDGTNDFDNNNNDEDTTAGGPSIISSTALLADMTREQLQEQARLRVQQQLGQQKKKNRQQGAFRKKNSNKTYVKGKRVFQDIEIS